MSGETEDNISGWTVDTLRANVQRQIDDLRVMLDERYQTQTKATDAAFAAQQKAMETAFIAADKAVQTALLSAEKAVTKAEVAAEKRFEATNEFRGQLADQAATFMPRTEADATSDRLAEQINELKDRMNRAEGRGLGLNSGWGYLLGALGAASVVVALVLSLTH